MIEFIHKDQYYRARKMDTFTQMNVLSRCGGIIGPMFSMRPPSGDDEEAERRAGEQVNAFLEALRRMTDEERRYVAEACLTLVQRRQGVNGSEVWADLFRSGRFMFQDVDNLFDMLQIVSRVLREVFLGFLSIQPDAPIGSSAEPQFSLESTG